MATDIETIAELDGRVTEINPNIRLAVIESRILQPGSLWPDQRALLRWILAISRGAPSSWRTRFHSLCGWCR